MIRTLCLFIFAALCASWAQAAPHRQFKVNITPDGKANMIVCLPESDKATGRAVVVCPGGGYEGLAMENEGTNWIPFFTDRGIACMILTYRMPHGDLTIPVSDAEKAITTVRDSAEVWNINPYDVGIMGSSAGGHLASTLATHAPMKARPDFQILFYPVITMDENRTHAGSVRSFLGEKRHDRKYVELYSNELQVRRHVTPPALILLATDDTLVPPVPNGVAYFAALRNADIPAAMYAYAEGEHGFGSQTNFVYHKQLLEDMTSWLDHLKAPRKDAVRVACIGNSITDGCGIDMSSTYGYPARLQQMLGDGYNVRNYGVSARTLLSKGDWPYVNEPEWTYAKDFRPDIVVLKLGTNDSKPQNWVHGDEFEADLRRMISQLKALDTKPEICLALPMKVWENSAGINDSIITNCIIPIIRRVAKKEKAHIIDLHTPFEGDRALIQADGIHSNREGAAKMAGIVAEEIKKLEKDGKK